MTTFTYSPDPLAYVTVGTRVERSVIRPNDSHPYGPDRCDHHPVTAGAYTCTRDNHPAHHRHIATVTTYTSGPRDEVIGVSDLAAVPDPLANVTYGDTVVGLADLPYEHTCGFRTAVGYTCSREKHPEHWQHIAAGSDGYVIATQAGIMTTPPDVAPAMPEDMTLPVFPGIGSRARLRDGDRGLGVIFSGAGDGRVRVAWADGPDFSTAEPVTALEMVPSLDGGPQGRQSRAFAHLAAQIADAGSEDRRKVTELESRIGELVRTHAATLENIRDDVIGKYNEGGSICEPGLNAFLERYGMEPIEREYVSEFTVRVRNTASDEDSAQDDALRSLRSALAYVVNDTYDDIDHESTEVYD